MNRLYGDVPSEDKQNANNFALEIKEIRTARNNIIHGNGISSDKSSQWKKITGETRANCELVCIFLIELLERYIQFFDENIRNPKGAFFNPFNPTMQGMKNTTSKNKMNAIQTSFFIDGVLYRIDKMINKIT